MTPDVIYRTASGDKAKIVDKFKEKKKPQGGRMAEEHSLNEEEAFSRCLASDRVTSSVEGSLRTLDCERIVLIKSLSEMNSLRQFWEKSQQHPGVDFEFYNLLLQIRANIISPCILVIYRNEKPVALLVCRIEKTKLPIRFGYKTLVELAVRQLVVMAGGFMGEKTEQNWSAMLSFIDSLLVGKKLDLAIIEQVEIGSFQLQGIKSAFKFGRHCQTQEAWEHRVLSLPKTWESFLKNRSRKHRYWLNRLPRVLDREFSDEWKIQFYSSPMEAGEFIENAEKIAVTTYQRMLGVGFRDDEEMRRRIELDAQRGQLRGYVLFIKDEPKAFWYCFIYGRTMYLVATGYEPKYRSYELGTILLMKICQDYCGTDVDTVDFGIGDAEYKKRFASNYLFETSIYIFPKTLHGLWLNVLWRTMRLAILPARYLLNRLGVNQRLKTYWRRRLLRQGAESDKMDESEASD